MGESVAAIFSKMQSAKEGKTETLLEGGGKVSIPGKVGAVIPAARLFIRKHSLWLTHKSLVKTGWENTSQVLPLGAYEGSPEIISGQTDQFGEKLTEKMFMEAKRKSSLQIARLYHIDSSFCLKTFTSSGFLYVLVLLEHLGTSLSSTWFSRTLVDSG